MTKRLFDIYYLSGRRAYHDDEGIGVSNDKYEIQSLEWTWFRLGWMDAYMEDVRAYIQRTGQSVSPSTKRRRRFTNKSN